MNSNQFDGNALIPIKVVLLGEMAVGKTSIITQYTKKAFDSYEKPTTSSQFSSHVIYIDEIKRNIKFDIWDTAGQEKYRSLTKVFYRDAHCCLLVYDITNSKSFNELGKYWVKEVKENVNNKNMIIAIAGNKIDMEEFREVSDEKAKKFADTNDFLFSKISAKTNTGLSELFVSIAKKILMDDDPKVKEQELIEKAKRSNESKLLNDSEIKTKKGGCC